MRLKPEDFDFPCSAVWRAYYSGELYCPDAEEVRRAKQREADLAAIVRWAKYVPPELEMAWERRDFEQGLRQLGLPVEPAGLRPLNE